MWDKRFRSSGGAAEGFEVDERPPLTRSVLFGLQHALVMYAGVLVVPIVVGSSLGLSGSDIADLVSVDLILAGIGTLMQTLGLWVFGIRMPLVVGAASSGIVPMVLVGHSHGLATVYGSLLVAGVVWVLAAPYFSMLLRLFPEVVTGTVITLIGLTLIPVGLRLIAGSDPSAPGYGGLGRLGLAGLTIALIVIVRRAFRGLLGQLSTLLALVIGAVVGWSTGIGHLTSVGGGPIVAVMSPLHFGALRFHLPSILLFLVIVFVLMVEGAGQGLAVGEVVGKPVGPREISRLLRVDGLMTGVSGICNGFVYTTFGQNIGLIALTGVRSRYPVAVSGVVLIVLGVIRPVGQVAAAIPEPVIGAAAVVTFGALIVSGIQLLARVDFGAPGNLTVVMLSLGIGLAPAYAPAFYQQLPTALEMFCKSGVATGTVLAVGLNAAFNAGRRRAPDSEPAAPQSPPEPERNSAMTVRINSGATASDPPRLIVGVTGASAAQLAVHLLTALRQLGTVETHLVLSRAAHRTLEIETGLRPEELTALADVCHARGDIAASIASGSFPTLGMVVVPCSMKTLAGVAHGYSDELITRAADVCLKERRRLVLVTRETPLSLVHLRNMTAVTEAGAIVLPPVPAFYQRPASIEDLLAHTSGKILDQFGIEHDLSPRWAGPSAVGQLIGGRA